MFLFTSGESKVGEEKYATKHYRGALSNKNNNDYGDDRNKNCYLISNKLSLFKNMKY